VRGPEKLQYPGESKKGGQADRFQADIHGSEIKRGDGSYNRIGEPFRKVGGETPEQGMGQELGAVVFFQAITLSHCRYIRKYKLSIFYLTFQENLYSSKIEKIWAL
jgi:hypothetical protein